MFTLDTNILIYYAAGDNKIAYFLDTQKYQTFYLPSIVVVEFLSYPLITPEAIIKFKRFAQQTTLLNLDFAIAERAADIRRNQKVNLADSVIAASALLTNSELITRNTRDFQKIKNLHVVSL